MHLSVNKPQRAAKQRAHTATHMLHYFLDAVLWWTKQAGSLVDDDYLRFDFAAKEPLSFEQIQTIETLVNEWIINDQTVTITEMSLEEAKKTWAKAFFEDKYGDIVRVVQIPHHSQTTYVGNSTEFCGGTHVQSTSEIGAFKITNQEAVASWIRRLEAMTWPNVAFFAMEQEQATNNLAQILDCSPKQLSEKIQKTISELQQTKQQNEHLQQQLVQQTLLQCKEIHIPHFSYQVNLDNLWITNIPLKQIALCARTCRPEKNRLLYTNDWQFALCADATKNAKELQQLLWLKWWGDNQLIQGKDEKVIEVV